MNNKHLLIMFISGIILFLLGHYLIGELRCDFSQERVCVINEIGSWKETHFWMNGWGELSINLGFILIALSVSTILAEGIERRLK